MLEIDIRPLRDADQIGLGLAPGEAPRVLVDPLIALNLREQAAALRRAVERQRLHLPALLREQAERGRSLSILEDQYFVRVLPIQADEADHIFDRVQDLRAAAAHLDSDQGLAARAYYDEEADARARAEYYAGAPLERTGPGAGAALADWLHTRLRYTHTRYLEFNPSLHVYRDLDVHPDGALRCLYSGERRSVEELLRNDRSVEAQRRAGLHEMLDAALSDKRNVAPQELKDLLFAVEDRFPYSCEHAIPESWFGKRNPMRGDLHHQFVCDAGYVAFRGSASYSNLEGASTSWDRERSPCGVRRGAQFEPKYGKGAVARAVLYFLLRYRTDRDLLAPLLAGGPAFLALLRGWHEAEPVGLYERHRNAVIQRLQGCRNPLIDSPSWPRTSIYRSTACERYLSGSDCVFRPK